jgi:hypothetical protein
MAIAWGTKKVEAKKLLLYNDAGSWAGDVKNALPVFKSLCLGLEYEETTDKENADVVIKTANGPGESIENNRTGGEARTSKGWIATAPHGKTTTTKYVLGTRREVVFAGIFLPGLVPDLTPQRKQVIIIHELIHASGLDGTLPDGTDKGDQDHDTEGIMAPSMRDGGDGYIEGNAVMKGQESKAARLKVVKPMPPIRVGTKTRRRMSQIWSESSCKK